MKNFLKMIKIVIIIMILSLLLSFLTIKNKTNTVKATSNEGSTSEVQLIARAINRRGKRRKL